MRAFLWIAVFLAAVGIVTVPLVYFYVASNLPPLETEFDVLRVLRLSIESERRSVQLGQYQRSQDPIEFARPDVLTLPKDLVALYINERGCPTFFQSPREDGLPWAKRMFYSLANVELEGDGWCEALFAWNLGLRVGAKGSLAETVATHKIHRVLKKDSLVAYDLASYHFAPGIIGVEDASKLLFKKPLSELSLAQLGEFGLALPPHGYFDQILDCQNPTLIRQNRDVLIDRLAMAGLIPMDKATNARGQPVTCVGEK